MIVVFFLVLNEMLSLRPGDYVNIYRNHTAYFCKITHFDGDRIHGTIHNGPHHGDPIEFYEKEIYLIHTLEEIAQKYNHNPISSFIDKEIARIAEMYRAPRE